MRLFTLILLILIASNAVFAQSNSKTTEKEKKSAQASESICYVNSYKTKDYILFFFKPDEINLSFDYSEADKAFVMRITVEDAEHPVLMFLKNKASLLYKGEVYEHNKIPDMQPGEIAELYYHKADPELNEKNDLLEIVTVEERENQ